MRFTPKTEDELQTESLAPDGIYNYEVIKSVDGVSQAGNEKTDLTLKIWDSEAREHLIFTNLSLMKLLKHFCDVNGLQDEYNSGNLPAEKCLHKSGGRVMIGIQGEKPDGKGGVYRAKNIVKDYISDAAGSRLQPSAMKPLPDAKKEFTDDDLPF